MMDNVECLQLPATGLSSSDLSKYDVTNFGSPSLTGINWLEVKSENLLTDKLVQTYMQLISIRQFQRASDLIMKEIFDQSKVLAGIFGITITDSTDMSHLFDELMSDDVLNKKERNRLNVLQMVLDGIDIETYEYGRNLESKELAYLLEFLGIITNTLSKYNVSIGYSTWRPESYSDSLTQSRSCWISIDDSNWTRTETVLLTAFTPSFACITTCSSSTSNVVTGQPTSSYVTVVLSS